MKDGQGWHNEPGRHGLAARGIKTSNLVGREGIRMVARGEKYHGWSNYNTWLAAMSLDADHEYVMEKIDEIIEDYINENERFNSENIISETSKWLDEYLRDMVETDIKNITYPITKSLAESGLEDIDTRELARDILKENDNYNKYVKKEN